MPIESEPGGSFRAATIAQEEPQNSLKQCCVSLCTPAIVFFAICTSCPTPCPGTIAILEDKDGPACECEVCGIVYLQEELLHLLKSAKAVRDVAYVIAARDEHCGETLHTPNKGVAGIEEEPNGVNGDVAPKDELATQEENSEQLKAQGIVKKMSDKFNATFLARTANVSTKENGSPGGSNNTQGNIKEEVRLKVESGYNSSVESPPNGESQTGLRRIVRVSGRKNLRLTFAAAEKVTGRQLCGRFLKMEKDKKEITALVVGYQSDRDEHRIALVCDNGIESVILRKTNWNLLKKHQEPWYGKGVVGKRLYVWRPGRYSSSECRRRVEKLFGVDSKVVYEAYVVSYAGDYLFNVVYTALGSVEKRNLCETANMHGETGIKEWDFLKMDEEEVEGLPLQCWGY